MNCTLCGKSVVLIPSAKERAEKTGGQPEDYIRLFTTHADCQIAKRNADTLALLNRINGGPDHGIP